MVKEEAIIDGRRKDRWVAGRTDIPSPQRELKQSDI